MKVDFTKLSRAFTPQCVAVVGDSGRNDFRWLHAQREFKGKLYSVQVNPESIKGIEALGIENFTSLTEIPGPVDLVIVAVPRNVAPRVLEDCIRKDVAAAHFLTSGFAETGTEEGIRLEHLLAERAEQANFHLIGPNCMGIFSPEVGIRQTVEQYTGFSGPVGFIAQSGTHAITFSLEAHLQGVNISKSVSFGNGIVLDSTDYLEFFGRDPEIKAIGMYLEGVKSGGRFFRALRNVAARKPVVVWKGGRTEDGGRAIASHTGALAMSQNIWDAAVRQCGAVNVADMEEIIDTLRALLYLSPVRGNKVGVAGGSGGQSVAITDTLTEAGFRVPPLTQHSYDELDTFFSLVGGSYSNPIDTGNPNRAQMKRIMEILERDDNIDNLVLIAAMRFITMGRGTTEHVESDVHLLADIKRTTSKPVLAIVSYSTPEGMRRARDVIRQFQDRAIPAFPSMRRAASALRNALDYYRLRSEGGVQ